ncbi:Uncharacterised protein [Actinobacillus pleuropneumoniae]|uniref:hypothetical protein n=1 Tax=Actinobacillus pleuropneumoniae TaxID=715 RepID=UPI0001E4A4B3|nr:hypothetical protein [Actinobacillus pleuropneumoniae]EFM88703.1 hypothetical protein appser4_21490 [Actinobacillus pleuropneumoniae serovar 4 str. M62]UKH42076.1 hypothetical protein D1097_10100 [Actinobacillus pleuropneumoniae serovar 4 str. M62]SQF65674.1 Uncharacterised protein [Actinobacillus pleuropneumoniae]
MMNTKLTWSKSINNDTNKYAVVVDRYFGLFDSLEQAQAVKAAFDAQYDSIDDSAHGYFAIIKPQSKQHGDDSYHNLSELQPIDVLGYVLKKGKRQSDRLHKQDPLAGKCHLPLRFERFKAWRELEASGYDFANMSTGLITENDRATQWLAIVPNADLSKYNFSLID